MKKLAVLALVFCGCSTTHVPNQSSVRVRPEQPTPLRTPEVLQEYTTGPRIEGDSFVDGHTVLRRVRAPQWNTAAWKGNREVPIYVRTNLPANFDARPAEAQEDAALMVKKMSRLVGQMNTVIDATKGIQAQQVRLQEQAQSLEERLKRVEK